MSRLRQHRPEVAPKNTQRLASVAILQLRWRLVAGRYTGPDGDEQCQRVERGELMHFGLRRLHLVEELRPEFGD